jgi:hypothetical protein
MKASRQQPQAHRSNFLAGGGEMGARIRAFDWSASPPPLEEPIYAE